MRGVTFSEFGGGKNVEMFLHAPAQLPGTPMQEAVKTAITIREKYTKDLFTDSHAGFFNGRHSVCSRNTSFK